MSKKKVQIGDKWYECEVKDGIRYIGGMTVDEFLETQTDEQNEKAARVGAMAILDEMKGIKPPKGKYQYYMNEPL